MLIAGCRCPDSAGSGRYSPAVPSRIEAMLETIAERPCDTRFRWDADDDGLPCDALISSPACECETPCMLPMFSIVSSILKKHCLSASLPPSLPLSLSLSRSVTLGTAHAFHKPPTKADFFFCFLLLPLLLFHENDFKTNPSISERRRSVSRA